MVYNKDDPEYIELISAEPEIEEYSKYSMLKDWLDKPLPELKRISRMLSNDSIIKKNKGLAESKYNDKDGKTVYTYDITDDEYTFKVNGIYEYTQEMEESYERNVGQNSKTTISNESQRQRFESDSDVLLPNSKQGKQNDSISKKSYEEWFDRKRNNTKSKRNKGELESSFSNETKQQEKAVKKAIDTIKKQITQPYIAQRVSIRHKSHLFLIIYHKMNKKYIFIYLILYF